MQTRPRFRRDDGAHRLAQHLGASLTLLVSLLRGAQGTEQDRSRLAFFGVEVHIAAGHGQSVGFAHRWANHDLEGKIQVLYHAANHDGLLGIFLSKVSLVRLHPVEQLGDHSGHAAKVTRPRRSLQPLSQLLHGNPGLVAGRIHFLHRRRPDQVHALGFKQSQIARQITRIPLQVLLRAKLSRVDKNAHHDAGALSTGATYQRKMAFVQIAHGRHTTYRLRQR